MTRAKVEFYRHSLGSAERQALVDVLDSLFLTTGRRTAELEERLGEYLGVPRVVGLMSCTHALSLSLEGLGVSRGDEVITTPMTFIATSNVVCELGATPVFVDVNPRTGLLEPERVAAAITPRTRALLPVHLYGAMVDMKGFRALADEHGLKLIEDAAHCVEGERDGVRPGQLSDAACFSFYATKNLCCGEGGAVATRHDELAEWLRKARLHGMSKDAADRYGGRYVHWDMEFLGHKANMSDIQAALLLPQLPRLDELLERRDAIWRRYEEAFAAVDGVDFPSTPVGNRSARHLFTIWVDPARRDEVLTGLADRGIGAAVNYRAVHLLSYYRERFGYQEGAFPNAERIGASTISLPLYPLLSDDEVERVIEAVTETVAG